MIAILYLAYLSTFFGITAHGIILLRRYPAGIVAPFSLLVPLFGIASGILVLGETFDRFEIAGGLLVITGLVIANFGGNISKSKKGGTLRFRPLVLLCLTWNYLVPSRRQL